MTPGLGKQLSAETGRHKRSAYAGLVAAEPPQQADSLFARNCNAVITTSLVSYAAGDGVTFPTQTRPPRKRFAAIPPTKVDLAAERGFRPKASGHTSVLDNETTNRPNKSCPSFPLFPRWSMRAALATLAQGASFGTTAKVWNFFAKGRG
jgi:hypothetical protein